MWKKVVFLSFNRYFFYKASGENCSKVALYNMQKYFYYQFIPEKILIQMD